MKKFYCIEVSQALAEKNGNIPSRYRNKIPAANKTRLYFAGHLAVVKTDSDRPFVFPASFPNASTLR